MHLVRLSRSIAYRRLGKTLHTADGRILLRAGATLTPSYIDNLLAKGYTSVYLVNEAVPDLQIDDPVNQETWLRATQILKSSSQQIVTEQKFDIGTINSVVEELINDIKSNADTLYGLSALRTRDDYTFVHSVNVCVLSLLAGSGLHLPRPRLRELGVGALLHDLGKVNIPMHILNKPGSLSAEEFDVVKKHTSDGFELLRGQYGISLLSAHVAFQHHEKYDGTGYPRNLRLQEIHEFARVAAVADFYDAVTSDRVYRQRLLPHEAAETLASLIGSHFDPVIARKFLERVARYPTGTIVRLFSGDIGVVVAQNPHRPSAPVVRILADSSYQLVDPRDLNLADDPSLKIKNVLEDFPERMKGAILGNTINR